MTARRYQHTRAKTPDTTRGDDWRDRAACRWQDPELFFAPGDNWNANHLAAAAKAVCRACPVRAICLEEALRGRRDDFAILGGTTPNERRALRRRRSSS